MHIDRQYVLPKSHNQLWNESRSMANHSSKCSLSKPNFAPFFLMSENATSLHVSEALVFLPYSKQVTTDKMTVVTVWLSHGIHERVSLIWSLAVRWMFSVTRTDLWNPWGVFRNLLITNWCYFPQIYTYFAAHLHKNKPPEAARLNSRLPVSCLVLVSGTFVWAPPAQVAGARITRVQQVS